MGKKEEAMELLNEKYDKTIEEEQSEASGEAVKVWLCPDCNNGFETKELAKDCCSSEEVELEWKCAKCDNQYNTKEEALECDCGTKNDSKPSGSILSSVIGFIVVVGVLVGVVLPVITSVTSQNQDLSKSFETVGQVVPLMIGVTVLLVVVAMLSERRE